MHAFLICGQDQNKVGDRAESLLFSRSDKIAPGDRIDLYPSAKKDSKVPTLTIEDVRFISSWLSQSSPNPRAVLVHQIQCMTIPAQHAFLKTLEEPFSDSSRLTVNDSRLTIILTADSETSLLPTIKSRCKIIRLTTEPSSPIVDSQRYSVSILQRLMDIGNKSPSERLTILYELFSEFSGKKFSPSQQGSIPRPDALKFMEYIIDGLHQRISPLAHQSTNPLTLSPYPLTLILQAACLAHRRLKNNLNVQLALQQFIFDIPKM